MASPAPEANPKNMVSHFRKTVTLRDWWLIKPEDDESQDKNKLAVAGFTSGDKQAKRGVFKSAAISKASDIFTLETVDGIFVILQGFINKDRTTENGFPSEVFKHFVIGFPPNWEDYVENSVKEAAKSDIDSENTADLDEPTNNSESQNEGNEDALECGNTNSVIETQCPEALLGRIVEEVVAPKEYLSKVFGDSQGSEQPSNHSENTMKYSTEQTDVEVDNITPSRVKSKRGSNARLCISRDSEQSSICFENKMSFPKQTDAELDNITPSKVKSKRRSSARLCKSRNAASSKIIEDLKGNQKPKDVAGLPMDNKNKQAPKFVQHLDRKGLKKCSDSPLLAESDIQQRMLKTSRVLRNLSDSGKSKENEDKSVKGSSSTRKAKRKIVFETPVQSPRTQKSTEKTCIVSPDSFRRSRSGRLLLPTLEFWRNQVPIYDTDRNVTGVQVGRSSSVGSKSDPKKQKKRRQTCSRSG
ncbi:hypothetical protein M5689_009986 [Euphorbia peplus]|nr:hypothetical protein M5689_009986 [Euphorbia peplus]